MKYIVIILFFIFCVFQSKAQTTPSGFPSQSNLGWTKWRWIQSDSGLMVAVRDTLGWLPRFTGTMVVRPQNRKPYYYDSTLLRWFSFDTDTTSLSNRINLKLNISDTVSMLTPYLRKIDTTAKWITSVYRKTASDSVFYVKGGQSVFAFTDSIGASGGSGTVTSVALSMPSAFTVTGSPVTTSGTFSVSGAGTSLQYIRGNGTLATFDTTAIPSFSVKVRGLFSGTTPINYNEATGTFSLADLVTAGACTNCNITFNSKGQAILYSSGAGSGDTAINVGSGIGVFKDKTNDTFNFKSLVEGYGINFTNNTNDITTEVDTTQIATQYDLTQIVSGINQLTGDVTAGPGSGSQVATIANNAVTNAKFRQSTGLSIVGRSANSTGDVADITASNDNEILRRSGTTIGFGSINLASSNAVGSSILGIGNGGTGSSSFTTGSVIFMGASALSQNNSNFFWDNTNARLGLGTITPNRAFHISKQSDGVAGTGVGIQVTDTRTSGNYRIAFLELENNENHAQLMNAQGEGLNFEPFNNKRGVFWRNTTAGGGAYITNVAGGNERRSMTLLSDSSTGFGYNHVFTTSQYTNPLSNFGGHPTLYGAYSQGNGAAFGYKAHALNFEATALGPQAYADGLATIALGDGARAQTHVWGGNIAEGGVLGPSAYGNQIVIGDATYADSNINVYIGSGGGLKNNFAICLGCFGSSTTYTLSATDRDHQGFLGWYDTTSPYFNFAATGLGGQGVGLVNDWWLGGPVGASFPHDVSLRVTSLQGTDKAGVNWRFYNSRSTGNAVGGDFIWMGNTIGSSGTTLNDSIERMRLKANGNLLIGNATDLGSSKLQVTGTIQMQDGNQGSGKVLTSDVNGVGTWQNASSATTIYNGDGTLASDRTVSTGGFTTTWSGANNSETSFSVVNTGTGNAGAISGASTSYLGVYGSSTTNNGVQGESSSGVGVVGVSATGAALRGQINPSSNNAIENIVTLLRTSSSGAGANNIGGAIQYELETATSGTSQIAGSLAFKFTDATNATRTSQFEIYGVNSGTLAQKFTIKGTGQIQGNAYGSGTFTSTPTFSAQWDASGNLIEGPLVASGTWTATLTAVANVNGTPTFTKAHYTRVGNEVTYSIEVVVDATASATVTELRFSLPISSNLAAAGDILGTLAGETTGSSAVSGHVETDAANDEGVMQFTSQSVNNHTITVTGHYTIFPLGG